MYFLSTFFSIPFSGFFAAHGLDLFTTLLGLAYILLEYRASKWLWAVGFVMQVLDIMLYYEKGLYADCAMEFYYIAMTIYGFLNWTRRSRVGEGGRSDDHTITESKSIATPVTHFPLRLALPWTVATLAIWGVLWYWLTIVGSTVPVADAFTTALSFVGIWALARKYLEQWVIWIVVDVVTSVLYFYKDIPFKASLYALYVVIAVMGYWKWRGMMKQDEQRMD